MNEGEGGRELENGSEGACVEDSRIGRDSLTEGGDRTRGSGVWRGRGGG